jgi:hypothetical protein
MNRNQGQGGDRPSSRWPHGDIDVGELTGVAPRHRTEQRGEVDVQLAETGFDALEFLDVPIMIGGAKILRGGVVAAFWRA